MSTTPTLTDRLEAWEQDHPAFKLAVFAIFITAVTVYAYSNAQPIPEGEVTSTAWISRVPKLLAAIPALGAVVFAAFAGSGSSATSPAAAPVRPAPKARPRPVQRRRKVVAFDIDDAYLDEL